jgi:hypothetical protein
MVKNFDERKMDPDVARLYRILVRSGMSITHFARLAGVSREYVYSLLNGKARVTDGKRAMLAKKESLLSKWHKAGYIPATGESMTKVIARLTATTELPDQE